jgi:O-antigen ligase
MLAVPGILALIILVYARPQEFFDWLQALPLLYIAFGLAVFGLVLDFRLRNIRPFATPQLLWVIVFYAWIVASSLLHTPRTAHLIAIDLGISVVLFVLIAHGVQSFRALAWVAGTVVAMVLFVAGVGMHQGFADTGCVLVDERSSNEHLSGTPDGRPCKVVDECYEGDREPGARYMCERIGLFGTTSVAGGRVRYRGVLQDPNELALVASVGLPLVFALSSGRRRLSRWPLLVSALALILVCTILTRSRGGMLVFVAVLGTYFLRRFGARGVAAGALVAAPVIALGGRGGLEADASSLQRIEAWYEAISLWRANPVLGIGPKQFAEHHYLTAHNSFLLALAELGFFGLVMFLGILYLSVKIPIAILQRYPSQRVGRLGFMLASVGLFTPAARPETVRQAEPARVWAVSLLAAFAGLCVGIFFLSFAYHMVLWIYVGLTGALYSATKLHDPEFRVSLGWRDAVLVGLASGAFVLVAFAYTRVAYG